MSGFFNSPAPFKRNHAVLLGLPFKLITLPQSHKYSKWFSIHPSCFSFIAKSLSVHFTISLFELKLQTHIHAFVFALFVLRACHISWAIFSRVFNYLPFVIQRAGSPQQNCLTNFFLISRIVSLIEKNKSSQHIYKPTNYLTKIDPKHITYLVISWIDWNYS